MNSEKALIKGTLSPLIGRLSNALVRRGLTDIERIEISREEIESILSDLYNSNFDIRAYAAKKIILHSSIIKTNQEYVEMLVFPMAEDIAKYFEKPAIQLELFYTGKHYPPMEGFKNILMNAIISISSGIKESGDAILSILTKGTNEGKIEAAEFFAINRIGLSPTLKNKVIAELNTLYHSQDERIRLAAIYALTELNQMFPIKAYEELIGRFMNNTEVAYEIDYFRSFLNIIIDKQNSAEDLTDLFISAVLKFNYHLDVFLWVIIEKLDSVEDILYLFTSISAADINQETKCDALLEVYHEIIDFYMNECSSEDLKYIYETINNLLIIEDRYVESMVKFIKIIKDEITQR